MKPFTSKQEMIDTFKGLYLKRFGVLLSDEEALDQGMKLLKLFTFIHPELDTIRKNDFR